jgi:hypothetical protein
MGFGITGKKQKANGTRINITDIGARGRSPNVKKILGQKTRPSVNPININKKVSLRAEDIVRSFKIGKAGRK